MYKKLSLPILSAIVVLFAIFSIFKANTAGAQFTANIHPAATFASLGTAFTYQGQLTDGGQPANGSYDFIFDLYDSETTGSLVDSIALEDQTVVEGLFTVVLDYGDVFDGTALWLEIRVRPGDSTDAYTTLEPRQGLSATPYASYATKAGEVPWGGISQVPLGFEDDIDNDTLGDLICDNNQIAKWNDAAWTCALDLTGGSIGWSLTGNAGTTAGTNFLGTTDDEPLELRVNSLRAFLLEPNAASPNIIAGYSGNSVGTGVEGSSVAGGGRDLAINQVDGNYSAVGGGAGNTAGGYAATLGGGEGNESNGSYSTVAGGAGNIANDPHTSVGGGQQNNAAGNYATIGGGHGNLITDTSGTIAGGGINTVYADYATVGGGHYNSVAGAYGTIAGGGPSDPGNPTTTNNQVLDNYGTVSGGGGNVAGSDDIDSTNAQFATVGGGQGNTSGATHATVGGGNNNTASGYGAIVGGGVSNNSTKNYTVVAGGTGNTASGNNATVSGGTSNTANQTSATVGGGNSNTVAAPYGTIPGGTQNYVSGLYGFAAGYQARAEHQGSFVWSDSSGGFSSTANDQFLIDASGGVGIGSNTTPQMLTVQGSGLFLGGDDPVARGYYTSSWRLLDAPSAVYASGDEVYVTSSSTNTLAMFNVSDPGNIVHVGYSTSNLSGPNDVFVSGTRAYVTSQQNNRLVIFDISNPSNIDSLGSTDESLVGPSALYVAGKYAYIASNSNDRLAIFDISDPQHIRLRDFNNTYLDGPTDVFVAGSHAFITSGNNNRLTIFDVSDPRPGQVKALGFITDTLVSPSAVYVSGLYAYVVAEGSDNLVIFDVSDPDNIKIVGSTSTNLSAPRDIFVADNLAYVASSGNDRLVIFDISDPSDIVALGYADTGVNSKPVSLFVNGKYVYVVSETANMLLIFEVNHLETPILQAGVLRTAYLDVMDNAAIENDLAIHGGLQVGTSGAFVEGPLSVAGHEDSHFLGALSVGGVGQLISDTVYLTRSMWITGPTHALDVIGEGRFRINDYNNLAIRSPNAGADEDAYLDFFSSDQASILTPTARIEFDASDPFTHTTGIHFHTQGPDDPQMVSRLEITPFGDVRPDTDNTYNLGDSNYRWEAVYAANGTIQTSDIRWKENITELPYGLEQVKQLQPVAFTWKDGSPQDVHYGLVAQEVAEVLPEVVEAGDDPQGTLGMNYSELIPVLIRAMQEQQVEIDTQAEQIASLEARLSTLEGSHGDAGSENAARNPLSWIGALGLVIGVVGIARRKW
jgi:hypothetical protein